MTDPSTTTAHWDGAYAGGECSGLPIRRYSPDQIAETLGDQWQPESTEHEEHTTPTGIVQPFSWVVLRRE